MHPEMIKLMGLQRLDADIRQLQEEIAAQPRRVAELQRKLAAVEGQRAVVVELLAKEELLRRKEELEIKEHQAKAARLRKQLDLATTTAQVTALEHEIAFAEGEVRRLEDEELASMERTEAMEAQLQRADEAVADAAQTLTRERQRASELVDQHTARLAEVEAQRKAERASIDADALSLYDRIARAKGVAVSEALNQQCTACRMMLRPQRWNDLRDRDQVTEMMTCDSCGRLLYYDPARDSPQRKTVPVESIAASIVRSL
ncbi:MAG: hypothetical protein KGK08_04975 [Acidobacteriota bacterium]|nr:hypothetical protein [Acidobacteriota bacterium]